MPLNKDGLFTEAKLEQAAGEIAALSQDATANITSAPKGEGLKDELTPLEKDWAG